MKPEAQRIAIAEARGWKRCVGNWNRSNPGNDAFGILPLHEIWTEWWEKDGKCVLAVDLPDYLNDNSAIAGAVQSHFDDETIGRFVENLYYVAFPSGHAPNHMTPWVVGVMLCASPAEWSKAFCLTVCPDKFKP